MALQWPVDKLTLINRALAATGNSLCSALEDGSDEYTVCSPAYEDGLAVLCEEANWGFITKVVALNASATVPADADWDTAYDLPSDLIHIIWVKLSADGNAGRQNSLTNWDILNNQIVTNAQGGPPPPGTPRTPDLITMKYASSAIAGPESGTPLFVRALSLYVTSAIYRGLHEDTAEADKMFAAAQAIAQRARTRYDQQKPGRQLWNSRLSAARRVRRPWNPVGGWGGSGIPN